MSSMVVCWIRVFGGSWIRSVTFGVGERRALAGVAAGGLGA